MSKVLVEESNLTAIASAIRSKLGAQTTYKPGQMATAIGTIPTGVTPTGTVSITQNGTVDVTSYASAAVNVPNTYAPADEGKVVSSGALVAQTARASAITANGTYDTTTNNSVTVNVSGGGGGGTTVPADVAKFVNDYASKHQLAVTVQASGNIDISGAQAEYSGYIYGNTTMITDLDLVLLGDFSQDGKSTGNVLTDSIANYQGVVLQGVYQRQRQSGYNTSIMYLQPALNTAYWTGMKDRNIIYDCNVTFTDNTHCSLSGNKQVIIYGILQRG